MSESLLQSKIVKDLRSIDAIPVENPAYTGTPDINYVDGWLELKYLPSWPKKKDTIVRINHITPQQRVFWVKRSLVGGKVYVLLQVGVTSKDSVYLLFDGITAEEVLGKAEKHVLWETCLKSWDEYPGKELIRWIV